MAEAFHQLRLKVVVGMRQAAVADFAWRSGGRCEGHGGRRRWFDR
jgi:hypothetical protein